MNAKEYLSQAYWIDKDINAKLEQAMSLWDIAHKCTSVISDVPPSGSRNVHRLDDIITRIVQLEHELNDEIDSLIDLKEELRTAIAQVPLIEHRLLLELRYLCYRTWEEIAERLNYSTKYVYELHLKALEYISVPDLPH